MTKITSAEQLSVLLDEIGNGVPNSQQYQLMSDMTLDFPESRRLIKMDPFSLAYKQAAMELYLFLRGRADEGYVPPRDELSSSYLPSCLWTDLVPWSFRDAKMLSEHTFAWGHILSHLNLSENGSVLEYGPGSGQLLLMLSRMGYHAFGVDIDKTAIATIEAQSSHLNLSVSTECAEFGCGFDGKRFDCILFYEAFHHAFNFEELLTHLHSRINQGGRVVLCGEPIVRVPFGSVPYPWGPRLDALSVFCIRRFGWMELGFTHDYFIKIAEITGWTAKFYPFSPCRRASIYVLEPTPTRVKSPNLSITNAQLDAELHNLQHQRASTSWRINRPLRVTKELIIHTSRRLRKLRR